MAGRPEIERRNARLGGEAQPAFTYRDMAETERRFVGAGGGVAGPQKPVRGCRMPDGMVAERYTLRR
jgi:hypothetical protein